MNDFSVGIDIGSSKVCTVLGNNKKDSLQILGVGITECKGLKKGVVVNIDETVEAIKNSVIQAELMSGMEIKSAFINLCGGHASLVRNRGIITISRDDGEITQEDLERVLDVARVIKMPVEREIIGVIPLCYTVDNSDNIKDPVGMVGVRLEAEVYIITVLTSNIQNLVKSVEKSGVNVSGVIIDPIASSEIALSKEEKEIGVALVDIGGDTTDISFFINGDLVYTKMLPIGGAHITNDISIGLKIPFSEAEALKRKYGSASVLDIDSIEDIPLNGTSNTKKTVTNKELTEIIEARVQEIFYFINNELLISGYKQAIAAGVSVTGGGVSFIKGATEAGSSILGLPVKIKAPTYMGVASPVYTNAAGIVKYLLSKQKKTVLDNYDENEEEVNSSMKNKKQTLQKSENVITKIKDFFTDFF
ncbi:cell division protein FtsA [Oxobacter pfennigii]|uniref:Cell division protein FtsA n=1 Tax=Oxobacter pfennigii TaxID=36849 RepID=A0A0P8YWD6_9CLOT|nr:cell division protein FtsA [Oxobacter pfennigii]KPU44033.1 cell division protein FtsA [Oxobacter pfennigii]